MKKIKYLTQSETKQFFSGINILRDKLLFLLMYRKGLRCSEVAQLNISDLDLENSKIYIQRLKGSLGGEYPLLPDELRLIKKYLRSRNDTNPILFLSKKGGSLHRCYIYRLFKKYTNKCGLGAGGPHMMKHSICMHLIDSGIGVLELKSWVGHKNINSTLCYIQVNNKKRDSLYLGAIKKGQVI